MSLQDGWDGWDGWFTSNAARGDATSTVAALLTTREALVSGQVPPDLLLEGRWAGRDPFFSIAAEYRGRIAVAELLQGLKIERLPSFSRSKPIPGARLTYSDAAGDNVVADLAEPTLTVDGRTVVGLDVLKLQLKEVEAHADLRSTRTAEILSQRQYNPAFWCAVLSIDPSKAPATLEMMTAAVQFASLVVQRVKMLFNYPRPSDLSPRIQPMIPIPGYSAYPMGHATEVYLLAKLLAALFESTSPAPWQAAWSKSAVQMLTMLAARISQNRIVAGIHFPVDEIGGQELAKILTDYFLAATTAGAESAGLLALWARAKHEWMV